MHHTIDFLRQLERNNDREWFASHRESYLSSEAAFSAFAEQIISGIEQFDPAVGHQTVRECTYRIYRDIRFSPDKSPYKTWKGVFVCPHGRKSGFPGYYVHVDPVNGHFMCAGLHLPERDVLNSVREEVIDNGDAIRAAISGSDGFELCTDGSLKRNPKGFPETGRFDDLLRLRDEFLIERPISEAELTSPDSVRRIVEALSTTKPFMDILRRATEYVKEP